jgi:hypothetical protein
LIVWSVRALSIAFFYSVGTGTGGKPYFCGPIESEKWDWCESSFFVQGIIGPVLFGKLIGTSNRESLFWGYVAGIVLLCSCVRVFVCELKFDFFLFAGHIEWIW